MTPPRLARWLLDRRLPAGPEGDTIRGDLHEDFASRAARSPGAARVWYWRAVLSVVVRYRRPFGAALVQDVRYAARTLLRAPAFTVVVLVTLALGIGANTAIFSALNTVLLEPLPYPDAGRLVRLVADNPSLNVESSHVSAADFSDLERDAKSFERIGAFSTFNTSMRGTGTDAPAERIAVAVEHNLLAVLGVAPAIGRHFIAAEVRPGLAAAAIVSHGFWRRRLGGDPSVLGGPLRPGAPTAIVGVMPRDFDYPEAVELWVPAVLDPVKDPRSNRMYQAVGRLRDGVRVEQAQAELAAISARLEAAYPDTNRGWSVRAVPLADYIVGDARQTLLLLLGAAGLVMLVACANVASLFLAHASGRRRELAVRAAIGAGRARIARQVLTESVLLSLLAGVLGVFVGRWGLQLLVAIGAGDIPRLEHASLDGTVLAFSAAIAIATGLLFGLLPALQLSRTNLVEALRDGARGAGTRSRTRKALVVVEVALALVLLVASGLLVRSFRGLQTIDVGFQPDHLLTMRVTLSGQRYRTSGPDVAYFDEAIRRVSALPGVTSASAVLSLPVGGGGFYLGRGFIRPDRAHPVEGYNAGYQIVTPGYFRTLGIPLLKGRDFNAQDTAAGVQVAVIGREVADRFFPGEDPLGRQVLVWRDEQTPRVIVGVAGAVKSADVTANGYPQIYVPHTQSFSTDLTLVVRTVDRPDLMAAPVKRVLQSIDATQAAYAVKTFETIMADALARKRFSAVLFTAFALLALALAAVGLYGVMTHVVNGRRHEMGVRLALGAEPAQVRGLVVRQALWLLLLGIAAGAPAALAGAGLLGNQLYGVGPADPVTLTTVLVTLGAAAWIAAYIPARRATRVDPASVLRID